MTGQRVTVDRLAVGDRFVPPGKKRPVAIIERWPCSHGRPDFVEFACESPQGLSALCLHRSHTVGLA